MTPVSDVHDNPVPFDSRMTVIHRSLLLEVDFVLASDFALRSI